METTSQAAPAASTQQAAWLNWLPLILLPTLAIWFRDLMPAWLFMWSLAFAIFAGLKWMTWWKARNRFPPSPWRSMAYLMAWPGMDSEAFLDPQRRPSPPQFLEWLWALSKTTLGALLLWQIARRVPEPSDLVRGWVGLLGLIFLLHFGSFHIIALFWQTLGIDATPIMSKPILSRTLSEFWGKRWNLGFRQLAYNLIFQRLHRKTGVAAASLLVFLASGLVHDLVISFPARGGYGLPTAYFILQGLGVTLERSSVGRRLGLQHGIRAWSFLLVVAAAPAFWLFHPPFVIRVILPFMHAIHAL